MDRPNTAQLRAWRQLGRELDADQMDAIFHMIDAFTDEADSDEGSDDQSDDHDLADDPTSNVIPFERD